MKLIRWLGGSFSRIRAFPKEAKREAGYQLNQVQQGKLPDDWKPMTTVGAGVIEIRIHDPHEYRVMFVAKYADAVYVLHAFGKKTQKTAEKDLRIARAAYAELKKIQKEKY
jgi:phage-related protein